MQKTGFVSCALFADSQEKNIKKIQRKMLKA